MNPETPAIIAANALKMKSDSWYHGYYYVRRNRDGLYYAIYTDINTGLHPTPELAAHVLVVLCREAQRTIKFCDPKSYRYPECELPVPPNVNLDEIEYLRDQQKASGYQDVEMMSTRWFQCNTVKNDFVCQTDAYRTPAEAAWACHKDKFIAKRAVYVIPEDIAKEDFGKVDTSAIVYLEDESSTIGYKFVFATMAQWYYGKYQVNGINYRTKSYKYRMQAAWAVHHHLQAANREDRRVGVDTDTALAIARTEYAGIKSQIVFLENPHQRLS